MYQHHDAGRLHLHIVTMSIQSDSTRINTFNIGKNESEKAHKELETRYLLVRAESKKMPAKQEQKAALERMKQLLEKTEAKLIAV